MQCQFCENTLQVVGTVVVQCACAGAQRAELTLKQSRILWRENRAQAYAAVQFRRRQLRRLRRDGSASPQTVM